MKQETFEFVATLFDQIDPKFFQYMKYDDHNFLFLDTYFSAYFTRNKDLVKMDRKENGIELNFKNISLLLVYGKRKNALKLWEHKYYIFILLKIDRENENETLINFIYFSGCKKDSFQSFHEKESKECEKTIHFLVSKQKLVIQNSDDQKELKILDQVNIY